ncbi:MAG: hypothetical protein JKX76_02505 [Colwellia sp.]|nr:hypothetical protein [Colwellia sp.]
MLRLAKITPNVVNTVKIYGSQKKSFWSFTKSQFEKFSGKRTDRVGTFVLDKKSECIHSGIVDHRLGYTSAKHVQIYDRYEPYRHQQVIVRVLPKKCISPKDLFISRNDEIQMNVKITQSRPPTRRGEEIKNLSGTAQLAYEKAGIALQSNKQILCSLTGHRVDYFR